MSNGQLKVVHSIRKCKFLFIITIILICLHPRIIGKGRNILNLSVSLILLFSDLNLTCKKQFVWGTTELTKHSAKTGMLPLPTLYVHCLLCIICIFDISTKFLILALKSCILINQMLCYSFSKKMLFYHLMEVLNSNNLSDLTFLIYF